MKERPIIFNNEMVKAILDGRKTVIRRPVKEQFEQSEYEPDLISGVRNEKGKIMMWSASLSEFHKHCPFGQIGDILYVRETFSETRIAQNINNTLIPVYFTCDNTTDYGGPWKPSIHMPKKYARIWLEITDVRVEQLRNIEGKSKEIRAEGIIQRFPNVNDKFTPAILSTQFRDLWIDIYKDYDSNPWVWVIKFKRVER